MKGTYKSSSKKTLALAYGVTAETFNTWLKPIENQIGDYLSRCYTPKQVETIVKHLGIPQHSELICA
ncbi:DUF4248 domain-containing protein [Aquimarina algiphila]|uniref:DUF4248 domain-containing protein n=1 Tax=Aquimarina algiphila TaxID=2047982 RepID=A0A554VB02_9FLAO|nr:DUF4248 domain-containing protein [Aquimarina algiphila]TSE03523.1 DUF4248 domain-containing protein [Aquimarina algiphila]